MVEETKQKQDEPEFGHKPDQCVPSPPSLSSHSIYLISTDIDAVLTIATNHPWRCTLCLASHCSSFGNITRMRLLHVLNAVDNFPYQTSGKDTTVDFTGSINDWRIAIAWVACRSPTPNISTGRPLCVRVATAISQGPVAVVARTKFIAGAGP